MPATARERHNLLLPVVLSKRIATGSFAFSLDYLVDHKLELTDMDAKCKNDQVGASAYDPPVKLKMLVRAYRHGLISSRAIERVHAQRAIHCHQRRQPAQLRTHRQVCQQFWRADLQP